MSKKLLIILVKNPLLGKAKTRLAATIGKERALEVYQLLLKKTKEITGDLNCDKIVFYSDFIDPDDLWDAGVYSKKLQNGAELGARMSNAFDWAFKNFYDSVCIIGSDCYELSSNSIEEAFKYLYKYDVVLGPSKDGGYYLLGMNCYTPNFFENVAWSTDEVFHTTLAIAGELNLKSFALPMLSDVDIESDIPQSIKDRIYHT